MRETFADATSIPLRGDACAYMERQLAIKHAQFASGENLPLDVYISDDYLCVLAKTAGLSMQEAREKAQVLWEEIQPLARARYLEDPIDRIAGYYTPEERQFLRDMSERFPRVKVGLSYFGLLTGNNRILKAIDLIGGQPRIGWQRIGVPDGFVQSVAEHLNSGVKLADIIFKGDLHLPLIKEVFQYHDIGEVVIGDFTPHCPISKDDKIRLEILAIRLLTAARRKNTPFAVDMYRSFAIYEGLTPGYDDVRVKVKDLDLLEMSVEAVNIRYVCPPHERGDMDRKLGEFDTYVASRLQTPKARAYFEEITKPAHKFQPPEIVYQAGIQCLAI